MGWEVPIPGEGAIELESPSVQLGERFPEMEDRENQKGDRVSEFGGRVSFVKKVGVQTGGSASYLSGTLGSSTRRR